MKSINLLLFCLLFSSLAYAGNPAASEEKKSILLLHKQKAPVASLGDRPQADTGFYNRNYQLYQLEKKIHSGKALTISGIILLGGGAGVTAAAVGFTNIANNAYGNATGAITGAAMCYIIGSGCLVASIPLITIGAVRWSNGSFEKRMYMQLQGNAGPNGMGMKMTF